MTQHRLNHYMDGFKRVEYCEICSAESDALFCDCPGELKSPPTQPKTNDIVGKSLDKMEDHF